ncbi:MAG: hypothetical protein ABJQ23_02195 [Shimia thalassica]|uniref:hypothetical protein n=1 Tax=Shimia thalassica TaxID=1715693 RepID=UPI003299BB44
MKWTTCIFVFALWLSAFLAVPAYAKEQVFLQCDFPTQGPVDWIKPRILLSYKTGEDTAIVVDDIILRMYGEAIRAEMRDKKNTLRFNWIVTGTRDSSGNQSPALLYSFEYKKSGATANVHMRPRNFANTFRARGGCTPVKNQATWNAMVKQLPPRSANSDRTTRKQGNAEVKTCPADINPSSVSDCQ